MYAKLAATLWLALLTLFALAEGPSRPTRPDPALTPGATLTTDTATVCRSGYAHSVRNVSPETRRLVLNAPPCLRSLRHRAAARRAL